MSEDPEGDHIRDVYAYFGLAVYMAQILEHGVVNALLMLEHIPQKVAAVRSKAEWEKGIDDFYDQQFEKTLGQLLRALEPHTAVSAELRQMLKRSLEDRNFLAHRFFRERSEQFMTPRGRDSMIEELQHCRDRFKAADVALETLVVPIRRRYGYTDEFFEKVHAEYMAQIKAGI